ncbi:MAG TPA: hypothetical protein VFT31_11555 [Kribbella sp.]|nr:hypothetical protein [Kribbella sp.]
MARYDVTVRVRTGWPVSASGLVHLREVGRSLPGRCRLRDIVVHTEGFTELILRMTGIPPEMAIHRARLSLPRFDVRREDLRRIEVRRAHPLRSRRELLATWTPPAQIRRPSPTPTTRTA